MKGKIPTRRVGVGAIAGAVSAIAIWIIGQNGIAIPGEIASAITTVLTFGASYIIADSES